MQAIVDVAAQFCKLYWDRSSKTKVLCMHGWRCTRARLAFELWRLTDHPTNDADTDKGSRQPRRGSEGQGDIPGCIEQGRRYLPSPRPFHRLSVHQQVLNTLTNVDKRLPNTPTPFKRHAQTPAKAPPAHVQGTSSPGAHCLRIMRLPIAVSERQSVSVVSLPQAKLAHLL